MNPEHVAIVRQGAKAIEEWRRKHPGTRLDLQYADLSIAGAIDINSLKAKFPEADFTRARFYTNASDFGHANLSEAELFWANLSGAMLVQADLSRANCSRANLYAANCARANLSRADLSKANLSGTLLQEADLSGADLSWANLIEVIFMETDLSQAKLGGTAVALCDLSQCTGLDTVEHLAPSSIGVDTLIKSFRGAGNLLTPELRTFFLGAGVPKELLNALPRILTEVKYSSCFIAYGEPDRGFAERLYQDLGARGINRWMYAMDSTPGERTQREIGLRRREAEKFIVLCSAPGLVRDGVLKEIEEQMDEDPDKIIPISLDDLWKHAGFHVVRAGRNLKPFLMERNYADFGQGRDFNQGFQRLLRALQRNQT